MENVPMDIPVIKVFEYKKRYFLYDTYTNGFFEIKKEHYAELCLLCKIGITAYKKLRKNSVEFNDILQLINKGLLKYNFIEKVEHPETKNISFLLDRCVNDIVLQATRDCNFKCRYCLYAGNNDFERHHQKVNMSWEIAKKSIDFLHDHSLNTDSIKISFYGGEPLLNFDLIVKIVKYVYEKIKTKNINYNMTINGSLLTDEIIDFLVLHAFDVSISLDGPKDIQNNHRKFKSNGGNTFDIVKNNIFKIKNKYSEYFNTHISFLPVYIEDENFNDVLSFFKELGVDESKITPLQANLNGIDYIYSEYHLASLVEKYTFSQNEFFLLQNNLNKNNLLPSVWHHNGQCIPGIQRVFIDTYGMLFPCEKITEDKTFCIGNIDSGFDVNKVINILNIGKLTEAECKKCWAGRLCEICVSLCNDIDNQKISRDKKLYTCEQQKQRALAKLKYYIDSK